MAQSGFHCSLQRPPVTGCDHLLLGVGIFIGDGAGLGIVRCDRHLQNDAALRRYRQERRIGRRALFAQRRQHDRHHLVETRQHLEQGLIEPARLVALGRRHEIRIRNRSGPGTHAGAHCYVRRSSDECQTDPAPRSTACRDASPASPCSAHCPALCAGHPCHRKKRSAASLSCHRSARERRAAPWSCGQLRRRCQYAAGPDGP